MYFVRRLFLIGFSALALCSSQVEAQNQTNTLSPILPQDSLPFTIAIEEASFSLPMGLHSGAMAIHDGKWLFLAGRTNGLHGFGVDPFPPLKQNTSAYVVDFPNQTVYSRELDDPSSGLTQEQIDSLSVTSPQYFQHKNTLYISGGYGVDTHSGTFSTKDKLTAVDVPDFIKWVMDPDYSKSAARSIRQTCNPWMRVTGGFMTNVDNHLNSLLVFGQNFTGVYTPDSNGNYTQQVRRFRILDDGKHLAVHAKKSESPNPSYRRRDLNVVPIIQHNRQSYVALSGVFTLTSGVWNVPVEIEQNGCTYMADPNGDATFKQGMNNYVSANFSLYSPSKKENFVVLLGGITFEYFDGTSYATDTEIPFTNQVTTIKRSRRGHYSQYFMNNQYPTILSTGSNPGNPLLFGAGAFFIESDEVHQYPNQVIDLDKIHSPIVVGYIVGGIMSTVPNTNLITDSTASPYIFKVILNPRG